MLTDQNHYRPVSRGDAIAIVAPAGPFERDGWEKACAFICRLGYQAIWRDDVFERDRYLAGSDERRASELMWAFSDPQIKAVLAVRGGYGNMRLLEKLDFDLISHNPKLFMGFSDNSALLLALDSRCGAKSIHGPHFLMLPEAPQMVIERYVKLISSNEPDGSLFDQPLKVLRRGKAEGKLICSNLSLLTQLLGTPYLPDFKGRILVIEDVNEELYRIDRMLTHLKLAGVFEQISGLALGAFTINGEGRSAEDEVGALALELSKDFDFPLLAALPVGHIPENHPVPCGVKARIDGEAGRLELLETPLT